MSDCFTSHAQTIVVEYTQDISVSESSVSIEYTCVNKMCISSNAKINMTILTPEGQSMDTFINQHFLCSNGNATFTELQCDTTYVITTYYIISDQKQVPGSDALNCTLSTTTVTTKKCQGNLKNG